MTLSRRHAGGESRSYTPVLHMFCILRIAPWVISVSLTCAYFVLNFCVEMYVLFNIVNTVYIDLLLKLEHGHRMKEAVFK
jgi:hypothetical protein